MFNWLAENLGTIIVSLILIVIVALTIRNMIRNKKMGRSSCGCDCSSCNMCASCKRPDKKV